MKSLFTESICVEVAVTYSRPKDFIVQTVGKWFAKRTSNRPFLLSKYRSYSMAEVVPGRIHARAIFEQIKFFV
jgi:hypothetical protein